MTSSRSVFLASVCLLLSQSVFADQANLVNKRADAYPQYQECESGTECTGDGCVTVQGVTEDTSHIFGFSARGPADQLLICGALDASSYSFSIPSASRVRFGAYFGEAKVFCNDGAFFPITADTKVAYTYGSNPDSCTVTPVE